MRENIGLFKAKIKDKNEWIEGFYTQIIFSRDCFENSIVLNGHFIISKDEWWAEIDPETLCECTGLKDKNEKLIFEGDIINKKYDDWECNCEVVFGNYSIGRDDWGIEHITQGFALKFDDGSGYCGLGEKNKYKVIGNKFEEVESE